MATREEKLQARLICLKEKKVSLEEQLKGLPSTSDRARCLKKEKLLLKDKIVNIEFLLKQLAGAGETHFEKSVPTPAPMSHKSISDFSDDTTDAPYSCLVYA